MTRSAEVRTPHPVDEIPPARKIIPFGLQHVLVMSAAPISSVFLVGASLQLDPDLIVQLLSITFVFSGIGSIIQSMGRWGFGVRLPFMMLPGGAPVVMFIAIASEHGPATATGAVLLTAVFYFIVLPVFSRIIKFFPSLVIGTMIVIVGVNLIRINALLITGQPDSDAFGDPMAIGLGVMTIVLIVLLFRVLRGMVRQLAVMIGLVTATGIAALLGQVDVPDLSGPVATVPELFPFGRPEFDLLASVPLLIFALASMAEATGQTAINAEIVGKKIDITKAAPRTIRADALVSLFAGMFGTSLMVTSGENIGIVRVSNVKSRFVTAAAGVILIVIGLITPVARIIYAIPAPVVGGTGVVVFAILTVIGLQMLGRSDLGDQRNMLVVAAGLSFGLLPIVVPGAYSGLESTLGSILSSGVAMGALVAVLVNILFNHIGRSRSADADEPGASTDDAPDDDAPRGGQADERAHADLPDHDEAPTHAEAEASDPGRSNPRTTAEHDPRPRTTSRADHDSHGGTP
ncbi:uracil-xanthine permease family protein [Georgenia sp. Z1344]|uniref:uracil-xanthine permease family protein n=1 Tax=Georgenia sp. Z1344 TaxID=3416706 RepID=UPI003CE9F820